MSGRWVHGQPAAQPCQCLSFVSRNRMPSLYPAHTSAPCLNDRPLLLMLLPINLLASARGPGRDPLPPLRPWLCPVPSFQAEETGRAKAGL